MSEEINDVKALTEAFEQFMRTTQTLEDSHRRLEARAKELGLELAAKNRELALTNDYLNAILEGMSDGVIAVDTHGVITKFNRSAGVAFGYSSKEAVGRPFHELFGREFSAVAGYGAMRLLAKKRPAGAHQ